MSGGDGIDTLSYASRDGLSLPAEGISASLMTGEGGANCPGPFCEGDQFAMVERLVGGSGNDTLEGDNADNALLGGPGDDVLTGRLTVPSRGTLEAGCEPRDDRSRTPRVRRSFVSAFDERRRPVAGARGRLRPARTIPRERCQLRRASRRDCCPGSAGRMHEPGWSAARADGQAAPRACRPHGAWRASPPVAAPVAHANRPAGADRLVVWTGRCKLHARGAFFLRAARSPADR